MNECDQETEQRSGYGDMQVECMMMCPVCAEWFMCKTMQVFVNRVFRIS